MGSVAMGAGGSFVFEGYTVTEVAYCLYCDECGSFNIKCLLSLPKWMVWVGIPVIMLAVVRKNAPGTIVMAGILVVFTMIFTSDTFRHRSHFCGECGNANITRDNVLKYPEYDRSILDVSYEATIRFYCDDY